ncbi:MAG: ribulose-phosphate 3-epimerase, partial [Planctomycetes bacterium]|nr:ribulose-phosphate 3-epimerase [Planctomycetota bacterium]
MNATSLKASVSLWSADLSNLASEIQRIDPYADSYHLDVSDGTYATSLLLFFPDLVKSIRGITEKPFEVHLITQRPERWVDAFLASGVNRILFYPETTESISGLIDTARRRNVGIGISLALETPVSTIEEYLGRLDVACVVGTGFDVKGAPEVAEVAYEKVRQLAAIRQRRRLSFEIEADGAIRRHTVPRLRQCGVDIVVPGSLIFNGDARETSQWM